MKQPANPKPETALTAEEEKGDVDDSCFAAN